MFSYLRMRSFARLIVCLVAGVIVCVLASS